MLTNAPSIQRGNYARRQNAPQPIQFRTMYVLKDMIVAMSAARRIAVANFKAHGGNDGSNGRLADSRRARGHGACSTTVRIIFFCVTPFFCWRSGAVSNAMSQNFSQIHRDAIETEQEPACRVLARAAGALFETHFECDAQRRAFVT